MASSTAFIGISLTLVGLPEPEQICRLLAGSDLLAAAEKADRSALDEALLQHASARRTVPLSSSARSCPVSSGSVVATRRPALPSIASCATKSTAAASLPTSA